MKKIFNLVAMAVILILGVANFPVAAADYPTKPITIIVTVSPGGSNDIQCRAFASVAEKLLGQPVVVANKPGASGMIGLLAGAQAPADGYTLTGGSTPSARGHLCQPPADTFPDSISNHSIDMPDWNLFRKPEHSRIGYPSGFWSPGLHLAKITV